MKIRHLLVAALFAATAFAGAGAAHAEFAVTFDRPAFENLGQIDDTTTLIGWTFTANTDLSVTRLGLWDWEKDQKPEQYHYVGIWDNSGNLLKSVSVYEPSTPAHPDNPFHMADITPYTLHGGQTYTVAAILGGDYYAYHTPTTLDSESTTVPFNNLVFNNVTYVADAFAETDGVNFNNITIGSFSVPGGDPELTVIGGFGANFDAVPTPIPAAAYLLGSGLISLVGIRRRNK